MTLRHRQHRVALVPLDDRPCNETAPRLLARLVDYELLLPPTELLGHFTTPGRPDLIAEWLRQAADEVDCCVIALDMLAYGGLMASRNARTPLEVALGRLDVLGELHRGSRRPVVYGFNVIMRLSATPTTDRGAEYWDKIRQYSELAGRVAVQGRAEDRRALEQVTAEIPPEVLNEYLAARERNHQVNLRAIAEAAEGHLDFLALTQEDAAEFGLHQQEQEALHAAVAELDARARVAIYPGADEAAQVLLARFVLQHMESRPKIAVRFAGANGDRIADLEDRPISETVAGHIRALGGEQLDNCEGADFHLFVNTPPGGARAEYAGEPAHGERVASLRPWVADIQQVIENERLAAVADCAFPGGADPALMELLRSEVELHRLASFAAWNTAGNAIGFALAHAALRIIALRDKGAFDLAHLLGEFQPMRYLELLHSLIDSEKAHIQLLFTRFIDDWGYQTVVRPAVTEHVTRLLRASVFDLRDSHHEAEEMVQAELGKLAGEFYLKHFLGKECVGIGAGSHKSSLMLCELEETRIRLPWQRLFEVEVEVEFGVQLAAESSVARASASGDAVPDEQRP